MPPKAQVRPHFRAPIVPPVLDDARHEAEAWDPYEGFESKKPKAAARAGPVAKDITFIVNDPSYGQGFQQNGNQVTRLTANNGSWWSTKGTEGFNKGVVTFRFTVSSHASSNAMVGIATADYPVGYSQHIVNNHGSGSRAYAFYSASLYVAGSTVHSFGANMQNGSAFEFVLDFDNHQIVVSHNGAPAPAQALPEGSYHPVIAATTNGHMMQVTCTVAAAASKPEAKYFSRAPADWEGKRREKLMAQIPVVSGGGRLNILLMGPPGAGKSSFINTALTTCYPPEMDFVAQDALVFDDSKHVTSEIRHFKLGIRNTNIYLRDMPGFGPEDYKKGEFTAVLDGNLRLGWKRGMDVGPAAGAQFWNRSPAVDDYIHAVVFVLPAPLIVDRDDWKDRLKEFREQAHSRGMQCLVVMTKIDKVDERLQDRPDKVYYSAAVDEAQDRVVSLAGFPRQNVHRCKQYHDTTDRNEYVELMTLEAIADAVRQGTTYRRRLFEASPEGVPAR